MLNINHLEPYRDNFNIYNLITKIDAGYRLFFNKVNKCFYVINIAKNNQICLKFNNYSLNIMKLLQTTRVENSSKLFNYIDEYNLNLENNKSKNLINNISDSLSNLVSYSKRTNSITKNDINKITRRSHA